MESTPSPSGVQEVSPYALFAVIEITPRARLICGRSFEKHTIAPKTGFSQRASELPPKPESRCRKASG